MPRIRNEYSEDFKSRMIRLKESGKPRKEILNEYNIDPSTFDRWVKEYKRYKNKLSQEMEISYHVMRKWSILNKEIKNLKWRMKF